MSKDTDFLYDSLVEPKICPFCTNLNLSVVDYADKFPEDRKYQVTCYLCGASGPFEATYEEAILSWNKPRNI